jgi:hypothetical protein
MISEKQRSQLTSILVVSQNNVESVPRSEKQAAGFDTDFTDYTDLRKPNSRTQGIK